MIRHSNGWGDISERHVQAIWYDSALRPANLVTTDGEMVQVLEPGIWNLQYGPDFRDARLYLPSTNRLLNGDVEVHLHPSDWIAHGHGGDWEYRNVVAHLTWYDGKPPSSLPPSCITICIGRCFAERSDFASEAIDVNAYPYSANQHIQRPCAERFRNVGDALAAISSAGARRINAKAERMSDAISETGDAEYVFYEELLSALGYAANSESFRELARRLPLQNLPRTEVAALAALQMVAEMEVNMVKPWNLRNVRPCNSPKVRIADAAAFFTGGKPKHIGQGRSAAIITNVIVPFAIARKTLTHVPKWLPPESISSPVRVMAYRLLGRDHNPALYSNNGLLIQGLIQIYREYCMNPKNICESCSFAKYETGREK